MEKGLIKDALLMIVLVSVQRSNLYINFFQAVMFDITCKVIKNCLLAFFIQIMKILLWKPFLRLI